MKKTIAIVICTLILVACGGKDYQARELDHPKKEGTPPKCIALEWHWSSNWGMGENWKGLGRYCRKD